MRTITATRNIIYADPKVDLVPTEDGAATRLTFESGAGSSGTGGGVARGGTADAPAGEGEGGGAAAGPRYSLDLPLYDLIDKVWTCFLLLHCGTAEGSPPAACVASCSLLDGRGCTRAKVERNSCRVQTLKTLTRSHRTSPRSL